jgi:UPF0271 protein
MGSVLPVRYRRSERVKQIDLNSDLGESFGAYVIGDDQTMLSIITSANVACGFHGGDPLVMHQTLKRAGELGVGIGAHPSYIDQWGFGRRVIQGERPADIEKILIYQIGAIQGMARSLGLSIGHFKAHGALSNAAAVDPDLAAACARSVRALDPKMIFVAMGGTELERAGEKHGLRVAREVYADRAYDDNGNLVPRKIEGAVIHDPAIVLPRVLKMVEQQAVTSIDGKRIAMPFDTICVHGDNPSAVAIARAIRSELDAKGVKVRPMAEFVN